MKRLVTAACAFAVVAATAARAAVSEADLQIIARALTFMVTPLDGTVPVGIVYDPLQAGSVRDANGVMIIIGAGLTVGNVTLTPVLVRLDQMIGAPVDLFLMPMGLGRRATQVARAAEQKKIPCFTLDIAQVQSGNCALGVATEPKVQIYLNTQAASRTGTSFVPVFSMMITEF